MWQYLRVNISKFRTLLNFTITLQMQKITLVAWQDHQTGQQVWRYLMGAAEEDVQKTWQQTFQEDASQLEWCRPTGVRRVGLRVGGKSRRLMLQREWGI